MPQNNKHIINERRARVADLYLQGWAQYKIAEVVKVTQGQVSSDLKQLSKKWKESAMMDIDKIKARELAKIDKLEREYYDAWDRSKRLRKKIKNTDTSGSKDGKTEVSIEKEKMVGDPRFLDGILKCIAKREEIIGFGATRKLDITEHREVALPDLANLSDQDKEQLIEIYRKLR
jgi:hypothetical protein